MRSPAPSFSLLSLARLLVFAGIVLCIMQIYYANLGLILILSGSVLGFVAYFQQNRRWEQ